MHRIFFLLSRTPLAYLCIQQAPGRDVADEQTNPIGYNCDTTSLVYARMVANPPVNISVDHELPDYCMGTCPTHKTNAPSYK